MAKMAEVVLKYRIQKTNNMKNFRLKLQLLFVVVALPLMMNAQTPAIRYVSKASYSSNANDGTSWATAKKDIQDAINDLVNNNLTGEVWVAEGTYYPTESTESSSTPYYKSFKIPAGITVRGGFRGKVDADPEKNIEAYSGESSLSDRILQDEKNFGKASKSSGTLDGEDAKSGVYAHKTILCGDLNQSKTASLKWNSAKNIFDVTFYGNSYHVVWFAMNGFNADTKRANALSKPAKLEGCVVESGHAYTRNTNAFHPHEGYGGGIYMVANSFVYNCEVRNCDASRNGGGIYMDGGGIVRRTYVHNCQAVGIGTEYGLGGGICEDGAMHNSKTNPIVVAQSVVTNCVGRMGGGMALIADQTMGDNKYSIVANSTLVNNNTAQVEGGGVYTYKGGAVANMTIVRNRCDGSGIMQDNVVTGRAGGLYNRDATYVCNSVIWGNECASNNNIQYAASRTNLTDSEKTKFYYNAVSKMDDTDWSGSTRMGVLSLDDANATTGEKGVKGYPLFFNPTSTAGYLETIDDNDLTNDDTEEQKEEKRNKFLNWTVSSESYLVHAGISTVDLDDDGLTPAPIGKNWDMQFNEFNARPAIGAFKSQEEYIEPATNITYNGTTYDYAFFVDPEFINSGDNEENNGTDWAKPVRFLGNVLDFITTDGVVSGGALRSTPLYAFSAKKIAVFVKEGTVNNTRTWGSTRIRETSLDIPSNVSVFGSFNSQLTGTDLSLHNVIHTPTIISAKLMENYDYNVAHLINIKDARNIHIEGFKLMYANASSKLLNSSNVDGAAITINNSSDVKFRNITVSNCTADHGAAVYANRSTAHFENSIFHNNTSKIIANSGIVYGTNGSTLEFDHCDILRNVGHASFLGTANGSTPTTNHWKNTIFYGNMDRAMSDTNEDMGGGISYALAAFAGNTANATGAHCMFDSKSSSFASQFGGLANGVGDTGNKWQYNLQYAFIDGTGQGYPRFINPTKNAGVTQDGDQTYYGRAASFEPHNNNPIVNMASHADIHTSWGKDIVDVTRDFGGLPDIGAVENHQANRINEGENAYSDGQKAYGDNFFVRDYTPATGTQLDTYDMVDGVLLKNNSGKGIYTAKGELLDGSSWQYAINGNADYSTAATEQIQNSVSIAVQTGVDPTKYAKTFTIKTADNRYLFIDGTTPKTTTDVAKASHFEIEKATAPSTITTGNIYIRTTIGTKLYYLYRSGNNASTSTGTQRLNIAAKEDGFIFKANNYFYQANNNGSITANNATTEANATIWTLAADNAPIYTEKSFKQDGVTEITDEAVGTINASTEVANPLSFHVYKSLIDYTNSPEKKTYKIKRKADNLYLKNTSSYLYPNSNGDNFILIEDGDYGKYYIYDVTTQKYIYYYTGASAGVSLIRTGNDNNKTTWWIMETAANSGKLNFIYGVQPWGTTENYAISCGSTTSTAVSVSQKSADDAMFVLIANEDYDIYNYNEIIEAKTMNGLQFAVNSANEIFRKEGGTKDKTKEVWVGAGIYSSDPNMKIDQYEENCFVILDGVDVYGAFPKTGNPGMDQRQALVSQYVHVQTGNDGTPLHNYNDFETILEPRTQILAANVMHRVLGQTYDYNSRKYLSEDGKTSIGTCPTYVGAKWDGFTLRNGVYDSKMARYKGREGGAGAAIYRNVTLKNAIITNNTTINSDAGTSNNIRAGGIYMDGGILDAGYVINNVLQAWKDGGATKDGGAAYGGGVYMYSGTAFNSVIANNKTYANYADGGGIYIENANFFNNTIVNNFSDGKSRAAGGVGIYSDPSRGDLSTLNMFNCIIINNEGHKGGKIGNRNLYVTNGGKMNLYNCLTEDTLDITNDANNYIRFHNCKKVEKTDFSNLILNLGNYSDRSENLFNNLNLRLVSGSSAINNGLDSPTAYDYNQEKNITYDLIDYNDMDYTERIQDCRIDIGAYEFNGATFITPDTITAAGKAIYYVTPNGYGSTTAQNPENAACAEKLQRVLDAAGRYKYLNPHKQIIVKVANSYSMLNTPDPADATNFKYYATRTTDRTDQDVRVWSIIVPRGVEVWGGYTDKNASGNGWSNADNGFYERTGSEGSYVYTSRRNITENPTYFDSYYVNKLEKTNANTYHVVTFTDRIYDQNGYAYTKKSFEDKTNGEIREILSSGSPNSITNLLDNNESQFIHMSDSMGGMSGVNGNVINIGSEESPEYASNRAVIDGIFVSGGQADASTSSSNNTININSYGGAALVNDFAYVRNCILTDNSATNGGALALTDHALVSGCLIMNNEAQNNGGGIYVFEEGAKLSNGTVINSLRKKDEPTMDFNMAHVLTSTIVHNKAKQGGGVWYSNVNHKSVNVRFNSVAIWQNNAAEQSNVFGMLNPEQPTDDETISEEFYPFAYSAIQNVRASGTNNISVGAINHEGMRFINKSSDVGQTLDQTNMAEEKNSDNKYEEFGFYGLTEYSLLCSSGMPNQMYRLLKDKIAIADNDLLGISRLPDNEENLFVEIGARALEMQMPKKQLMLRLFVADPKYVDTQTAIRFMRMKKEAVAGSKEEYYSQVGSSFAYPFNSLQNALDYVKSARNGKIIGNTDAQNLPFEILVGKGEYTPKHGLNTETNNIWAATYAIPEGVTVIGGFNPQGGGATYYGRYYRAKSSIDKTTPGSIFDNVEPIPTGKQTASGANKREIGRGNKSGSETITLSATGTPGQSDYAASKEVLFQQWDIQDIADRRAMADNNKNGIIEPWEFANQTIISGNAVNGETDGVYHVMTAVADANAVGNMPKVQQINDEFVGNDISTETGYQWKEEGQQIRLNGLIVIGGNALTYLSTALDEYGKYIFYQGAGLQVDGNRYNTTLNGTPVFHNSAAYGVGYRDIPVSVTNCQFRNNIAGYGGAISTNGSLSLFSSSFEQNIAIAQTETPESGSTWTTNVDPSNPEQNVAKVMYPGQGGAILATRQLSAFNTLFANNEARLGEGETETIDLVKHPTFRVPLEANASATLRAAGGAIMMGSAAEHHIVNCNFVRNKANAYPAVFTMNPTTKQNDSVNTHNYSQIINTVAWGNEVNPGMLAKFSGNKEYLTASKLMVNIGKKNRTKDYIKTKSVKDFYDPAFTTGNVPTTAELETDDPDSETCVWQESSWFCAYEKGVGFKPNNTNDLRDSIVYTPATFAPAMIKKANSSKYQNCNLLIVSDNNDVAGPNFGNPSVKSGYDGFMEGADWSPARFNRLTDNGNGWIRQSVAISGSDYKVTFHNDEGYTIPDSSPEEHNYQGAYSFTHYVSDFPGNQFPEYKLWLAIGNEKYMGATNETETDEIFINNTSIGHPQKNYPRISPNPTMGVEKAYIDIGVYEYVKQPLLKPGNEVDVLWVSTKEKPENGPATGATWRTPTSDLQRAIETLLTSRNGHKKEIRIMEGEYTPVTTKTVEGKKYNAFIIDTKSLNESVITPTGFIDGTNNDQYYAQSLTIKGGYSEDIMYEYDPVQYKTIIRQNEAVDGVSNDHLIYIADPTLRYAGTDSKIKDDGAVFGESGESGSAKTMPIQIDGVTLINDKTDANKQGSAIYYPEYVGESPITQAHSVSVNGKVVYYPSKEEMEKMTDGKHSGTTVDYETEFALVTDTNAQTITNPAKIVISKTHVIGCGNKADVVDTEHGKLPSAVFIGQNGGSALIYNTVFHSNYGMPLDAYNTVNVNNTFAKNTGLVQLNDVNAVTVKSQMHNSVLWLNNKNGNSYGDQVHFNNATPTITGEQSIFTFNSFTGGDTTLTDYSSEAIGSITIAKNNYNTGLTGNNFDIVNGPNFVDPSNNDIENRNFDIKPNIRLLNKGNGTKVSGTSDTYAGTYYDQIINRKYDYSLVSTCDKDILYRTRIVSSDSPQRIDIGAYEFQGSLRNVLYVDPNKSHDDNATGENWNSAFGYGDIQNAMDLAAVYHMNNPSEESYVFVKGASSTNRNLNTNETLTIRDGVTVYGSIVSSYTDWHDIPDPNDQSKKKYAKTDGTNDIDAFIKQMNFQREGVASNAASKTIVTGIRTSEYTAFNGGTDGETPALVDGFVITNPDSPKSPVLDITNRSKNAVIVVRNIVVANNDLSTAPTDNVNVAQIDNGLIYEALFRDNKPKGTGAALKVGSITDEIAEYTTRGYAVNVTAEGKTIGADGSMPVDGMKSNTDATNVETTTQIFNSITNSINSGEGANSAGSDAPYKAITNKGISGYFYNIADPNLNYQLTETSKYIDTCSVTNPLEGIVHAARFVQFIDYTTDRDILGNPRLLAGVTDAGKIDRGAFETWKIQNSIGGFQCGDNGTIAKEEFNSVYNNSDHAIIKKHFYPHDGSVVYIMKNQSLVIDAVDKNHEVKPTPENPGYLLVKEGGNFYGNGRPVTCAYVAVERPVRKGGSIVAFPYAMDYDATSSVAKVSTDSDGNLNLDAKVGRASKYSSNERMNWKYIFQTTDSKCWDQISTSAASQGVLYQPHGALYEGSASDNTEATLRFTAKGTSLTDYVYTETNEASKIVTLTKNDDTESTDNGADYTGEEDMSWNCFGLPYLVSNYCPYETTTTADHGEANNGNYLMNIPHTLWLYYDGKTDSDGNPVAPNEDDANGEGGYYSVKSWSSDNADWHVSAEAKKAIWVGEGIFTQTATFNDTESLVFYRPIAPATFALSVSPAPAARYFYASTSVENATDDNMPELIATEYYTTDGVRVNNIQHNAITIVRNVYSNGTVQITKKFAK